MNSQNYTWNTVKGFHDYPELIKNIFIKVNKNERREFSNWIGEIGKKNQTDIDWWSIPLTSRNPKITEIFNSICIIETTKKLIQKKINLKIIVDSKNLFDLITKLKKNKTNKIKVILINKNKLFANLFLFLKSIAFQILTFSFIKIFIPQKKIINNNVNLIYTYPSLIGNKHERLFQIPKNRLKEFNKRSIFIPTFIITPQILKIFFLIKKLAKENYIFKEHVLTFQDLAHSYMHFKRIKKFNIKYKLYKSVDYSKSIFDEVNSFDGIFTRTTCILNYLFVKKISKEKLKIKKAICWLENQPEKCWTYAIRKYFPKTNTLGYQGYADLPQLMNTIPSKHEAEAKIIPEKIILINKIYNNVRKEFFKKLNTCVGPALIYQNIFKRSHTNINKKIDILVVLGEFQSINEGLLQWIIKIQSKLTKYKILIKKPKIFNIKHLIEIKNLQSNIELTDDNLANLMINSKILISSGPTAASIEGLAYGCYLINPLLDPFDPFFISNLNISKKNYFTAKNFEDFFTEITNFLNNYKNLKKTMIKPEKLKNLFFTKTNAHNIKLFL